MAKRKPSRIIMQKKGGSRPAAMPSKLRKEIEGSFGEQARRAGVAAGAGSKRHEHSYGPGWAGEVTLEGLTPAEKQEALNMVRHTGAQGPRDPNDRVVKIEDKGGTLRIFTAENRLAIAIGKRVHRARKGGTLTITWSPGDMPVRVHWKKG